MFYPSVRGIIGADKAAAETARRKGRSFMTVGTTNPEIRYYSNERTEEFSGITRKTITIDSSYRYLHKNPFRKIAEFLVYRVIMTPVAALWCKIKYRAKIVGREKLRTCGRFGYFLYGNHTLMDGDAFLPSLCAFPKKTMVVVNADNLSVPVTKTRHSVLI